MNINKGKLIQDLKQITNAKIPFDILYKLFELFRIYIDKHDEIYSCKDELVDKKIDVDFKNSEIIMKFNEYNIFVSFDYNDLLDIELANLKDAIEILRIYKKNLSEAKRRIELNKLRKYSEKEIEPIIEKSIRDNDIVL